MWPIKNIKLIHNNTSSKVFEEVGNLPINLAILLNRLSIDRFEIRSYDATTVVHAFAHFKKKSCKLFLSTLLYSYTK